MSLRRHALGRALQGFGENLKGEIVASHKQQRHNRSACTKAGLVAHDHQSFSLPIVVYVIPGLQILVRILPRSRPCLSVDHERASERGRRAYVAAPRA